MTLSGRTATALLVALVLSVCVNVFVAGLAAGRITTGQATRNGETGGGLQRFLATVPAEVRPVFRQALSENRGSLRDMASEVREARQSAAEILAAEPFDQDAFEVALAEIRDRSEALQAMVHNTIAGTLDQVPPEVRAQMAERWRGRQ